MEWHVYTLIWAVEPLVVLGHRGGASGKWMEAQAWLLPRPAHSG